MITWLSIHSSNTRLVTKECCAEYELIFNGPSLSPSPPPPPRLRSAPASSLVSCLHCRPCNSTLPWSRENNESEAQLMMFLTCFRTLCAKPAGRNISKYRHENYEGRDENTTRKKKEGNIKQNFALTLRTECWHLKPSVTWPSPTSSASCPSTLASHGWHSMKSQMRHCCFPPRAGAALLLLPTLPGVAQGPPPTGSPPTPLAS